MTELQKQAYLISGAMAILHNGKRYEQGDKIELTNEEAEKISLYVTLAESQSEQRQQAKQVANLETTEAEQAMAKAVETEATEETALVQSEPTKRKGKKQ